MISCIKPALPLSAVVLAMALLAVGCGGSGDSTASSPVTKTEFIKKAEFVCNKADAMQPRAFDAFGKKYEKELERLAPVPYEETVVRDLTLPSIKKQIGELEALTPPDGEEKRVNAIIAGWRTAVRRGEKDPYSVADYWHPAKDSFAKMNRVAARYGFVGCAELR